jgi:hypothetical protein
MIDFLSAIQKLNPNIKVIRDDIPYDAEGNEVTYDKGAVQAYVDSHAYIGKRQAEYPDFRDYLDGIVKGDQAQVQAYIDACNAVKNKYPKGQV